MKKVIMALLFIFLTSPSSAAYYIDNTGQIFFEEEGLVLGKNSDGEDVDSQSENIPPKLPVERRTQKIEVKTIRNQVKLEYSGKDSKNLITGESSPSTRIEIEKPLLTDLVTLTASDSAAEITRNRVTAKTGFPLSVNLETNELMVTTPKGTKIVTVLPDQAVAHMLSANVLDQAGGKGGLAWLASRSTVAVTATPSAESTPSGTITPTLSATETESPTATVTPSAEATLTENSITLTQQDDGTLTYEIPGTKTKKVFGVVPVTLKRTAIVSAETGELIKVRQSPGTRLLDVLSL